MKTFMTLGCSWTWGVGAAYQPGMSKDEYTNVAWELESEQRSFRSLLAKKYNLKNINFSAPGSSNQQQLRLASEYFFYNPKEAEQYNSVKDPSWPEFEGVNSLPEEIRQECINTHQLDFEYKPNPDVVLWALTSVSRNEVWDLENQRHHGFFYHYDDKFSKFWLKNIYDLERELITLSTQVQLWNNYFKQQGIRNIWVDTFNIHRYLPNTLDNLIRPWDLLGAMLNKSTEFDSYHHSNWSADDSARIRKAKTQGLVNPISYHPTARGHEVMAEFLSPYLEKELAV